VEQMVNEATKQELQRLYDAGYSRHKIEKTLNLTKKEMDEYIKVLDIHFMTRDEIQERNMKMLEIRNTEPNPSLEAIGEMFPVNGHPMTKEGVRLAINNAIKNGGTLTAVRGKSPNKPNKHTTSFVSRKKQANDMFDSGMNINEISQKLEVCEKTVVSYIEH
jgi:transposase-like protein